MKATDPSPLPIVAPGNQSCSIGCGSCSSQSSALAANKQPTERNSPPTPEEPVRTFEDTLLRPEERVLPTLERDGSRRWMQPQIVPGKVWQWRRRVAYFLMAVFVVVPHLKIGGKPFVLLDIPSREFTILGHVFLPTDTPLLALLVLSVFLTIVLATALVGRVWCGWGCPQTVFLEFLFRPIDRWFAGTTGKGGAPRRTPTPVLRLARWGVYLLLSMFLAHTFLAYFVGPAKLAHWMRSSPIEHPTAFLVMGAATCAMLFDFLFFREQLCLIACPYGRFQSVMLDRRSLIVAYDPVRGEPRHKGKRPVAVAETPPPVKSAGDCVDCNRCVVVCPTGIDIRDGLQLECINCAQCIDACNQVMGRVGLPQGLIRYSSQDALAGKPAGLVRPRTLIYPIILSAVVAGFLLLLSTKFAFDARISRAPGAPFTVVEQGLVQNNLRIHLTNRSEERQVYDLRSLAPADLSIEWLDGQPALDPGKSIVAPLIVRFPGTETARTGHVTARLEVKDDRGHQRALECQVLGPR